MMNDKRMKTVHELYGCTRKHNSKQRLKFAKKLFIRRYNEGYSAVYIYQQMAEWSNFPLTGDLIDHWLHSDRILSRTERQNNAISHVLSDDFQHMERINSNYLAFKYEIPIWRIQLLIDMYNIMEAENE